MICVTLRCGFYERPLYTLQVLEEPKEAGQEALSALESLWTTRKVQGVEERRRAPEEDSDRCDKSMVDTIFFPSVCSVMQEHAMSDQK